jgi:hypothetical protein
MSFLAITFLVFSLGFSWFAGDKKNDQLIDQLEESAYEQETMGEQVRQSKLRASVDAKKMSELTQKISKLSKAKYLVERKLERNKVRRARLLRPQIAKIKEKVEAPYKLKIDKMEKVVKTAKADMAKLKAENDKLKRQYRELIRKNKERVSDVEDLKNIPFTEGDSFDKSPITKERVFDKSPITKERGFDKSPITRERGFDKVPITKEDGLDKAPITKEDGFDKTPITKEDGFDKTPITKERGLDKEPLTKDRDLDKEPITKENDFDKAPITREELLPVVPEEELVELDNGLLVRLDNIDGREKIPASKDLVSADEILKAAEAMEKLPDYIRVEQVNVKEGWL